MLSVSTEPTNLGVGRERELGAEFAKHSESDKLYKKLNPPLEKV